MIKSTLTAILTLQSIVLLSAPTLADTIQWLDFTGWDHAQVTGGGQTFTHIWGPIDVTVTGTPGNSLVSSYDGDIRTGGNNDSHSFMFNFSAPLDLVLDVKSIDRYEVLTTSSGNPITYTHTLGALPTESGNLTITGNGVGLSATGALRGQKGLGITSSVNWSYTALRTNKYERFRLGTVVVPEPGSLSLLAAALLLPLRFRRF